MAESKRGRLRDDFERRLETENHGPQYTSDGVLLDYRSLTMSVARQEQRIVHETG